MSLNDMRAEVDNSNLKMRPTEGDYVLPATHPTPGSGTQPQAAPSQAPIQSQPAQPQTAYAQYPAAGVPPGSVGAGHLIKKLSVDLLKTYNTINQRYYAKRKNAQHKKRSSAGDATNNNGHDDEHSDYIVKPQERLNNRYVVQCVIGKGSFGRVVKAYDEIRNEFVAVKIVKSKRAFRKQAQIEIEILTALHQGDPNDLFNIVRMKDTFIHENHQCIAFELLSYNLYELLRDTKFLGVSLNLVRKFAKQLLVTLDFASKHRGGIIHCDLKPENILLRNSRHSAIKVIDFGSACFQDKKMYTYIQSRFYRAPEVLLGCSYSCAIDMWSLGCILVEMHTGKPIFDGANALAQVTQHYEVLGLPPAPMLESGRKSHEYFVKGPDEQWRIKNPPEPTRIANGRRTLRNILGVDTHGPKGIRMGEKSGHSIRDYMRFEELVSLMLKYDPRERISPAEALNHKFFQVDGDPSASSSSYTAPRSTSASFTASVPPSSNPSLYGGSSSHQPALSSHVFTNSVATHAHNGLVASSSAVINLPGGAAAVVSSAAPGVIDLTHEEELKVSAAVASTARALAAANADAQQYVQSRVPQQPHLRAANGIDASQSYAYVSQ